MKETYKVIKNKHIVYIILTFLICILSGLLIYLVINNTNNKYQMQLLKDKIEEQKKEKGNKKSQEIDIRHLIKNENIVFLGDSITNIYPLEDVFENMPIINSGISGYKTHDILDRMDNMVYKYNPTKVFLLIGINDYILEDMNNPRQEISEKIIEILKKIKENRPKAKLYLESIYPIDKELGKWEKDVNNEDIIEINKIIKEYAIKNGIIYIDLYNELTNDKGDFDNRYTDDGLHPNLKGYVKITSILMPYILQ